MGLDDREPETSLFLVKNRALDVLDGNVARDVRRTLFPVRSGAELLTSFRLRRETHKPTTGPGTNPPDRRARIAAPVLHFSSDIPGVLQNFADTDHRCYKWLKQLTYLSVVRPPLRTAGMFVLRFSAVGGRVDSVKICYFLRLREGAVPTSVAG